MGRLKTLTILLTLGAWGLATDGAPPDDAAGPAPPPAARPKLPRPASEYARAVGKLLGQGKYSKAAQYLKVAQDYRDELTEAERHDLDACGRRLDEIARTAGAPAGAAPAAAQATADPAAVQASATAPAPVQAPEPAPAADQPAAAEPVPAAAPVAATTSPVTPSAGAPPTDHDRAATLVARARQAIAAGRVDEARRMAREADALNVPFADGEDSPRRVLDELESRNARAAARGTPADKTRANWLLHAAREQLQTDHLDEAQKMLAEARALNVHYGFFDLTPTKVAAELEKARARAKAKGTAVAGAAGGKVKGDKAAARARLKEAEDDLKAGRYDEAEAIAVEVDSWGLRFGVWEQSPRKLAAASRALRRQESLRNGAGKYAARPELYASLVRKSREALAANKLDEAESTARQALRMNVAPSLKADRAEDVLNDVAMARARGGAPMATQVVAAAPVPRVDEALRQVQATGPAPAPAEAPAPEPAPAPAEAPAPAPAPNLPVAADGGEVPAPAPADEPAAPAGEPAPPGGEAVPPPAEAPETPASPAEPLLEKARTSFAGGDYPGAREAATQARAAGGDLAPKAEELLTQITLAEQQAALSTYEAALAAVRKGEPDRARALLNEVVAAAQAGAALDEGVVQRVQDLLIRLPRDGEKPKADDPKAAADATASDAEALKAQQLNAQVSANMGEVRRLMETDPDKAIALLQKTAADIKAAGAGAVTTKILLGRVEARLADARRERESFMYKMQDKTQREEIERKRLRILEANTAKLAQMKQVMDRAHEAELAGKYDEAEALARKAMEIDPNEIAAQALAWKMRAQRHYEIDLKNRSAKEESFLNTLQQADATMNIPAELDDRAIAFPRTFNDINKRRAKMDERLYSRKDPRVQAIEAKLNEPITLTWKNQPLGDAIDYLRNYTGLNIHLDTRALADESLTEQTPVTFTADKVTLRTALKYILEPLGLTYRVDDEVLLLTTPSSSHADMVTRPYDVADLVITPHSDIARSVQELPPSLTNANFGGPNSDAARAARQAAISGQGNAAGAALAAEGTATGAGGTPRVGMNDMMPLIQLITTAVAPGTWRVINPMGEDPDSAGYGMGAGFANAQDQTAQVGTITPFFLNISLIIRHRPEVQDQVVDLLRQLRKLQDLQVSVEVRFITVSDDFFEQIGIDFDFNILSKAYGKKSSFAALLPGSGNRFNASIGAGGIGAGGVGAGGVGAGGVGAGGVGAGGVGAGGVGAGGVGAGTTAGTTIPYAFNSVRDYAYGPKELVIGRNSSGSPNSGTWTPDLSIPFNQNSADAIVPFNAVGSSATTFGIAFLSDLELYLFLTAIHGDSRSNIVQAPKVTTFNGALASVVNVTQRYYVSELIPIVGFGAVAFFPIPAPINDGVRLFALPVVTADRRYVRLTLAPIFQTLDSFATFTIPAAVGGGGLGGGATAINGQIQLPQIDTTTISTTVTVPDGGTVLLGGVKRLQEQRLEFGTPILDKMPLVDRLFRNVGIGRRTSSLMLMVTPRIVILEEEEERLGIPSIVPTVAL